ncbi:MAG TPA: peptidoglycan-binding protein [Gemmatimonadales bacterium]
MNELVLDQPCARGSKGARVRMIQEWLTLHRLAVVIDGDYGPATQEAVRRFQRHSGLGVTGTVDRKTYTGLVAPMAAALAPIAPGGRSLRRLVVAYARQHLRAGPREVGGQNAGPWVRLYMDGNQGVQWPWCAGFACFVLRQACAALAAPTPIQPSFSCDSLAASARVRGVFVPKASHGTAPPVRAGAFFLNRRTETDWDHTGIVLRVRNDGFDTIEGNTNDEGSREGYEVCRRVRGYGGKDFVRI